MNATMTAPKLSASNRPALRSAITSNPGWKAYRSDNELRIDTMSSSMLIAAAEELNIDLSRFLTMSDDSEVTQTVAPDTYTIDELAEALDVPPVAPRAVVVAEKPWTVPAPVSLAPVDMPSADPATLIAQAMAAIAAATKGPVDMDKVNSVIDAKLEALSTAIMESVAETAASVVAEALASAPLSRIEVKGPDSVVREVRGHKHPMFVTLLKVKASRMSNGFAPSVWIAGPAGSGKTHAGKQLAETLGLPFHLNGALSMPHELLGFIDAAGNYHRTPFREAYENGGVYMFDEVDASDNSALLALNAALANGDCAFPDKQVTRHADCYIVASANTFGLGATADYVGRAKIDAAFLSRFPVKLSWDYDTALEIAISGNESFARRVIKARAKARDAGLKVLIDPRASQAGGALIAAGFSEDEAAELTYLANLKPEQRSLVV